MKKIRQFSVVLILAVVFFCALAHTAQAAYESWNFGEFKVAGYDNLPYREFYPQDHKIGDMLIIDLNPDIALLVNFNISGTSIYAYLLFRIDGAPVYWFHLNVNGEVISQDLLLESCAYEKVEAPLNQFNIGDSIGEGEAANGIIGDPNHETVWSTGYEISDSVDSINEQFENRSAADYYENTAFRDPVFNHALSGAVMADFATQAGNIVNATYSATPSGTAGMITILLGNNDVCASSLNTMTDPSLFEDQYRAGLDMLAESVETSSAYIHVSSIPAIYWLWNAKLDSLWCRLFVWPNVPCENLLANSGDDCESAASRLDPDTIYSGDGPNCMRRKIFHAKIRDIYNPILRDVLQEYIDHSRLPNAYFVDVFDVQFDDAHINNGDCFHPSETGHALLSETGWCRSHWGTGDFICVP